MKEQVWNCDQDSMLGRYTWLFLSLHLQLKQSNQPTVPEIHVSPTTTASFFMTFLSYPNSNCFSRSMQVLLPPQTGPRRLSQLDGTTSSLH